MTDTDALIEAWEYIDRLRSAASAVVNATPYVNTAPFADSLNRLATVLHTPPPHRPPPSTPTDPQSTPNRRQGAIVRVGDLDNLDLLHSYLDDGWEPYAVTTHRHGWDYHLRRPPPLSTRRP